MGGLRPKSIAEGSRDARKVAAGFHVFSGREEQMSLTIHRFGIAALGLALGVAAGARASVTVYTDAPSFQAATSGLTNVNFNGIVGPTSFQGYSTDAGGYTDAATGTNFNYAQASGDINITGRDYYSQFGYPNFPGDVIGPASNVAPTSNEIVALPHSVTAFSMDLTDLSGPSLAFTLSNGDQVIDLTAPPFATFAFFGFTDTTPFSTVTVTGSSAILQDVNFSAVPEPSSVMLLGMSSLLVAGWRVSAARMPERNTGLNFPLSALVSIDSPPAENPIRCADASEKAS